MTKKRTLVLLPDGTAEVPLTKGKVAIIDACDMSRVAASNWTFMSAGYACRHYRVDGLREYDLLHRFILDAPPEMHVDHVNGNRLDNRRSNIRLASRTENQRNRPKPQFSTATSRFKGVSFVRGKGKWRAYIFFEKKQKWLGCYPTETEAAQAYNAAAIKYFGPFAHLNDLGTQTNEELGRAASGSENAFKPDDQCSVWTRPPRLKEER